MFTLYNSSYQAILLKPRWEYWNKLKKNKTKKLNVNQEIYV